jgi:ribosomal protein S18 acetylase RimI-like enzyme
MLPIILCILLAFSIGTFILYKRSKAKKVYHKLHHSTNSSHYSVKKATIADIDTIRSLALEVWPKTYSQILSPQQVIYMLNKKYSKSSLLNQMHAGNQFNIYFYKDKPVGFSSYSEVKSHVYKINKLYILTSYQRLGLGRFAINHIIKEITKEGAHTLILHVNKHNSAKLFYEKLGFYIKSYEETSIGNGFFRNDYLMELPLSKVSIHSV